MKPGRRRRARRRKLWCIDGFPKTKLQNEHENKYHHSYRRQLQPKSGALPGRRYTAGALLLLLLTLFAQGISAQNVVITSQPSSVNVTNGGAASFTVTATGDEPMAYQWFFNGAPLNGATNATLEIARVTPFMNGY